MSTKRTSLALASLLLSLTLAAACGAPTTESAGEIAEDLSTPLLSQPIFNGAGSPEPAIAVGNKFIYSLSSGSYKVFARDAAGSITNPGTPYVAETGLQSLFDSLVPQINAHITYPSGSQVPNCSWPYTIASQDDSSVTASTTGCIGMPYDSDVIYDRKRDRFWIMTHLRNMVYPCPNDGQPSSDGWYTTQYWKNQVKGTNNPPTCVQDPGVVPRRFIAVAVTKAGGSNSEDPNNGFWLYGLVDDAGDWPQMMVHGDYLLLDHRDTSTADRVYAFSADALANNTHGTAGTALVEPAWKYGLTDHGFGGFQTNAIDWNLPTPSLVPVTPDTSIFFVKQPYSTDGNTYMVAGMGTNLVFYALPPLSGNTQPRMIIPGLVSAGATVPENLGDGNRGNFVPGAWHNGTFYWAWPACNGGTFDPSNGGVDCTGLHVFARAVRVPLSPTTWSGNAAVQSSTSAAAGYLSTAIGESDPTNEYALPIVGVNKNSDWLVEFSRYPAAPPQYPDVRYTVMYHDQSAFNPTQRIKQVNNMWTRPDGAAQLPGRGGSIDSPSVVADPLSPTQLWMSYGVPAASPNEWYNGIFTAADIGSCAGDSGATDRFRAGIVGCGGHVAWAYAAPLCAPSYHVCSADEWLNYAQLSSPSAPAVPPTANYWTSTVLDRYGSGSNACTALPPGSGGTSCGSSPMHICTENNGGTDAFGNTCQWTGCNYSLWSGDLAFGGCQGNTSAGALCCAN